ncbi:VPLPA-CTERM-specific exosortase XrtD [Ruegeria halocynthiae]|uniref:VPLPA-CTERM-specific exosortase XrtD n=1 Tax=Ruegeria halocynthiae TaxID=985054 RepID=UPI000945CD76
MDKLSSPQTTLGAASALSTWGMFWLLVITLASFLFFEDGFSELLSAWRLPEYSHGPLIPVLSLFLFLRQLKTVPIDTQSVCDRRPGVALLVFAFALALIGKLVQIGDIVAYAMILWVGAVVLLSFGWQQGRQFWPPVFHLIYMLPLPIGLYYGVSTYLQGVSSELGVFFLQMMNVPVFLDGNIIDLGVYKLHVAEACSGLRYLFPILSFSYIFAVLYQGPVWHKAVLLIAAAPITILMNSVRIAIAGVIVNNYGIEYVEGFSHFFEGWVIFAACIFILFLLAWTLVLLRRDKISLTDALDLETSGVGAQAMRLQYLAPSAALVFCSLLAVSLTILWPTIPKLETHTISRDPFALFPSDIDGWQAGHQRALDPVIEQVLGADDYYSAEIRQFGDQAPVDLFMAWYRDQNDGGVHSPEVCLPGAGWEIAQLNKIDAPVSPEMAFSLNRAIIQKGTTRMLVYFWFEQQSQRTSSGLKAKLLLLAGKVRYGRNDSAIVRLITPISSNDDEGMIQAENRLNEATRSILPQLPRFIP